MSQADRSPCGADLRALSACVQKYAAWVRPLREGISRVVIGRDHLLERMLIALLADGHLLLEGVPGLGKARTLETLACALGCRFRRVHLTPDALPSDVAGVQLYRSEANDGEVLLGPVHANFVLLDGIDCAPPRVQSVLLEAMQEGHVTIGKRQHALPDPHLLVAGTNPVGQEDAHVLPQVLLDRFLMQVDVAPPSAHEERALIDVAGREAQALAPETNLSEDDVFLSRVAVSHVFVDDRVKDYVVSLVHATRESANPPTTAWRWLRTSSTGHRRARPWVKERPSIPGNMRSTTAAS